MRTRNTASILAAVFLFVATVTGSSPGDLDPTFGNGGKLTDTSGYGAYDVAIQPDGRIVAAGGGGVGVAVFRYNADGSPDMTFGSLGKVNIAAYQTAVSVAVHPDGKISVATRDPDGKVYGELLRLNSDGSIDTTFGQNGLVPQLFLPSIAAVQPDGKLLLNWAATLLRLNTDGSYDTTFSPCQPAGPTLHFPFNRIESVIQPDGRILTAFTSAVLSSIPVSESRFGVFRCNADGTLDTSFGSEGSVITPVTTGLDVAHSIALQTDGKIVVSGQSGGASGVPWRLTVVRHNANGSLDPGFGAGGVVTLPTGAAYWVPPQATIAVQPDGKVVASTTKSNGSNRDFTLIRFNPDGSLDTKFGGGDGEATVDFAGSHDDAFGMAIDSEGRAVVVGSAGGFAIARFLLNAAAVAVSVSGRVMAPSGAGLRNVVVSLTDPQGVRRTATTSSFGIYTFSDVPAGVDYAASVSSRRYRFTPRDIAPTTSLTGVDFVGSE